MYPQKSQTVRRVAAVRRRKAFPACTRAKNPFQKPVRKIVSAL